LSLWPLKDFTHEPGLYGLYSLALGKMLGEGVGSEQKGETGVHFLFYLNSAAARA
jgi:hypothetical protein